MKLSDYLNLNRINHAAFARQVETTRQSVNRWARGLAKPRAADMKRIAEVTKGKVTANDFYEVA